MDEILQELIAVMKREFPRRPPTNENLYDYYMSRVKKNLHVVLCFSPVSHGAFFHLIKKQLKSTGSLYGMLQFSPWENFIDSNSNRHVSCLAEYVCVSFV